MRVLQVCAVDFTAYHLLRPLGLDMRRAGLEVSFCCSPGEGLDLLASDGFETFAVPVSRNLDPLAHSVSLARLTKIIRRGRFDVVHTHTPVAGLLGRVAARLAGVPSVVYTAHGFYFHEGMGRLSRSVFSAVERFGAALSDLVFVQSEEDREEAVRSGIAPPEKLVHIGNGVDPELFGPAIEAGESEKARVELGLRGSPVIGFTGRIVREKGAVEFARAAEILARRFPGSSFLMIGAPLASDRDDCLQAISDLVRRSGLSGRLHMTGYRRDVPVLLSLMDLFLMPSYREGMPRSLLEAMASGLPVVATDIRGCREEVVDGVTGMLVPPRDHEALAEAAGSVLSDPDKARSMGRAGRARVLERFDERRITRMQTDIIIGLSSRKSGRSTARGRNRQR